MSENDKSNVYSMYWEVGAHTDYSKSIEPTIRKAISYGMYTCQFFMGNPKTFYRSRIKDSDIESCKKLLNMYPLNVFTHFPYIANLNGSVKSLAWNGDEEQDRKTETVLKELSYELGIVSKVNGINNGGVVIHPGCYPDRKQGLETIIESINKIDFAENSRLLLENCAGEGRKLCKDFKEIKIVLEGVNSKNRSHVGVCVDTAHIWGVGDYDLSKCNEVDRMFKEFDETIGISKFWLLHLNDSEVELGAKKDRHACLGEGYIWGESFDSLIHLLNKCKEYSIPMVLETHGLDMLTLSEIQPK